MSRDCVIYKITNIITLQIYIGSSINIKKRISTHFTDLKKERHHSLKMQRSYNKYGKEAFKIEYLLKFPEEYRQKLEQWFLDNNICYFNNEKIVGKPCLGRKLSEEHIETLREKMIGNKYHLLSNGLTDEGRQKLIESSSNRVWTIDSRTKLSNSKKGNKSKTGLKCTEDTRKLMSKNSANKRAIFQFNLNGDFIKEWDSILIASKDLNFQVSSIVNCCKGKRRHAHKFIWRYKNEFNLETEKIEPVHPLSKYNTEEIREFFSICKCYNQTLIRFNISSTGMLHYILNKTTERK